MINVGLVGFGFAGRVFQAPVIRAVQGRRLTTIVQRSGTPDPRYADVAFVRSVDELLTRPVDLVVIATPNPSHHPIAQQCLLAGRHVVVDKPFTTTLAAARELVELGKEQRRGPATPPKRRATGHIYTARTPRLAGRGGRATRGESHP